MKENGSNIIECDDIESVEGLKELEDLTIDLIMRKEMILFYRQPRTG